MLQKIFRIILCGVFMFTMSGTAFADVPNTAEDKLAAVENTLYGAVQTGPLLDGKYIYRGSGGIYFR